MTVDARAWDAIGKWHDSPDGLPGLQVLVAAAIRDAVNAKVDEKLEELRRACTRQGIAARGYGDTCHDGAAREFYYREASTWKDAAELTEAFKLPSPEKVGRESKPARSDTDATKEGT